MFIQLPPHKAGPLYRQVFEALRNAIVQGELPPARRLPATRELAQQLAVSRNTVNTAYDMLQAEGYIEAKAGSGFYVCQVNVCEVSDTPIASGSSTVPTPRASAGKSLSSRGEFLAQASRPVPTPSNPAFQPGLPDLQAFPFQQWNHCVQTALRNPIHNLLNYQDQGGLFRLKTALRDYLKLSRGVRCETENIIIVNGSQAGLDLVARLLVDPGDRIAVEEPGYLGARDGFLAAGADLVAIPVDMEGLQVAALQSATAKRLIKLAYTTPSYQFPTGATMSLGRRLELLQWADQHNSFIIEDDYDSEFRFSGRPLSCLQGLDQQQRVIYMGTFSKVLFPGLRMGYLVVPGQLGGAFAMALRKTGQDASLLLQAVVAEFIEKGYFASHLRKMRKLYGEKQRALVKLAQQHLSEWLDVQPTAAGMQLACWFKNQGHKKHRGKGTIDEEKLLNDARANDIVLASLSRYYRNKPTRMGLYLGYAGVPLNEMKRNVSLLKKLLYNASS